MQVSAFSHGKTRKAGSLTEKSGREIKFTYGLSKVEMERQESVYDEIFRNKARKNSKESKNMVNSSVVANSAFNENSEDEYDEYSKDRRNNQKNNQSSMSERRNELRSAQSGSKSARTTRNRSSDEDEDEEYERNRRNVRNRNEDDYDERKSARNRGGNRNRRDDDEEYDNSRQKNRNRNNRQDDDDLIDEIDATDQPKTNRTMSSKPRYPQRAETPETEINNKNKPKDSQKYPTKLSGKNNPFIVSSLKTKTDKSIEFIVGGDDDENVDPEKQKDIEIHPGFGEEIRNMADGEEIEDLENDFNNEYFETVNRNLVEFVQRLSPPDVKIRCHLEVVKGIFNEYILYLEKGDGQNVPLMMTKRKKASTKIIYTVYVFEPNTKSAKHTDKLIKFGKVNSSLSRRHYVLAGNLNEHDDDNISIGDLHDDNSNTDEDKPRKYFDLEYRNKVIGRSKPKDLTLNLNINQAHKLKDADGNLVDNTYASTVKNKNLVTKSPEYDSKAKIYRLDFRGRAKLPSTNNLQLIDANNPKSVLLQLGKMETKSFSLDFSYPFCAFTAFGLAVSCLSRN
jgi:hypothetical protein